MTLSQNSMRQKALPRKPLQTGLQLRRSAGLTPGGRVAAGRERDGKAKGTSHTGREGGGRRKQNEVGHSKTSLPDNSGRTHHDMMTNFCGSQESTAAGRHPRLVIQKPPFDTHHKNIILEGFLFNHLKLPRLKSQAKSHNSP